jgi:hypothetical protein
MLWAVRIRTQDETLDQMYAVGSHEEGQESASRLNLWIRVQQIKHPKTTPVLKAEVIAWPHSPGEHADQLAAYRAAASQYEE